MAIDSPKDRNPNPSPQEQEEEDPDDDFEDHDDVDDDEDDDDFELETPSSHREKIQTLFRRLRSGPVRIRVHEVIIKGNRRTNGSLIEAEVVEALRSATTIQELLRAAGDANVRLQRLDVFDSVSITLDAGPPEISGTANVVIEVLEPKNPVTGDLGIFTKPEVRFLIKFLGMSDQRFCKNAIFTR